MSDGADTHDTVVHSACSVSPSHHAEVPGLQNNRKSAPKTLGHDTCNPSAAAASSLSATVHPDRRRRLQHPRTTSSSSGGRFLMSGTTSERVASQGAHDQLLIVAQAGDYVRTPPAHGVTTEGPDELSFVAQARNDVGTERSRIGEARVSSLMRGHTDDDRAVLTAHCALIEAPETAQVRDYIRRVVDTAPPLTTEQHDKLAMLLRRSRR